jgi:hypothetical protein
LTFLRVKFNYRFHVIKSEINDRRQILVRLILKVNVNHKTVVIEREVIIQGVKNQ